VSIRERLRDPFAPAAVGLAGVAFAGSFTHTHKTVTELGQSGWVAVATALMPEVSVALSVLRIRRGGLPAQVRWAWLVLVTSAAFTLWANLMQAAPGVGGLIVGGWPAWAAIGAAGFIEMGKPAPAPAKPAARPVKVTATKPAPASAPPAAAPNVVAPSETQLSLVPDQDDTGPRDRAKAHALLVREQTGVLPGQTELVNAGYSSSTAKRALAEIRAAESAA
jgi:hypothetical protein